MFCVIITRCPGMWLHFILYITLLTAICKIVPLYRIQRMFCWNVYLYSPGFNLKGHNQNEDARLKDYRMIRIPSCLT